MNKTIILACDIGYGNTKIVFGYDADSDSWSEMCFKSAAPKALVDASLLAGGLSGTLDRVAIRVNGSTYLVGPEAHISGGGAILNTDFIAQDGYLALMRGSIFYMMKKSGVALKHIDVLVLGLSVSNWRPMQVELSRIAKGPHLVPVPVALRSTYGERVEVTIGRVLVLPQPMGALHNATLVHFQNGKKHAVSARRPQALLICRCICRKTSPSQDLSDWLSAGRGSQLDCHASKPASTTLDYVAKTPNSDPDHGEGRRA